MGEWVTCNHSVSRPQVLHAYTLHRQPPSVMQALAVKGRRCLGPSSTHAQPTPIIPTGCTYPRAAQRPTISVVRSRRDPCTATARPSLSLPQQQQEPQAAEASGKQEVEIRPGVLQGFWEFQGHKIRYQRSGDKGHGILLVHGFGANADHYRKNIRALGETHRVFAIDLLGCVEGV